jgi:hypothetical protein
VCEAAGKYEACISRTGCGKGILTACVPLLLLQLLCVEEGSIFVEEGRQGAHEAG